jgi:hypothetical protein
MQFGDLATVALGVHAFCSAVAMFLPPVRDADPRWYAVVYAVVNGAALNRGYARNAPSKDS